MFDMRAQMDHAAVRTIGNHGGHRGGRRTSRKTRGAYFLPSPPQEFENVKGAGAKQEGTSACSKVLQVERHHAFPA